MSTLSSQATGGQTLDRILLHWIKQRRAFVKRKGDTVNTVIKANHPLPRNMRPTGKGAGKQRGVFMRTYVLNVTHKVLIPPWAECLNADGTGPVSVIDIGGQWQTALHVTCRGRTDSTTEVEFEVVETNAELPGLIAHGLAARAAFYSQGGLSRAERFRDLTVIAHFCRLLQKKGRLEAAAREQLAGPAGLDDLG